MPAHSSGNPPDPVGTQDGLVMNYLLLGLVVCAVLLPVHSSMSGKHGQLPVDDALLGTLDLEAEASCPARPVAHTPVPAAITVDRSTSTSNGWQVNLAAFINPENAFKLVSRLHQAGYDARYHQVHAGNNTLWRVFVRDTRSRQAAEARASAVAAEFGLQGYWISHE